jgi:protoporphyrinogen oxidase
MRSDDRTIVVLGAGVTGLTAAWELSKAYRGRVVLLEKAAEVGGLAASFSQDKRTFDVGSHRLHENCAPEVLALLRDLCGSDLLRRERRGVIYLQDRPLRYPPSSLDVLFGFGAAEFLRFSTDFLGARLRGLLRRREPDNFEDFTTGRVGRGLYERFYKPYALKLYGMSPRGLDRGPALTRVRKFTPRSFFRDLKDKVLRKRPGYLYPAKGIGQLSTALRQRFLDNGGQLLLVARVEELSVEGDRVVRSVAFTTGDGRAEVLPTEAVVATIPLDAIHDLVQLEADQYGRPKFDLRWRGLRLLGLLTDQRVPGDNETYYFPEPHVPFGRVSELNKYSPLLNQAPGGSVLTVEVPCSPGDDVWEMPDDRLAGLCAQELRRLGILGPAANAAPLFSRKVRGVYPVYDLGWKERFAKVYGRLNSLENLYLIGRSALFLHCNIDHCMAMALRLAKHLAAGKEGKGDWEKAQAGFFDYRVRE